MNRHLNIFRPFSQNLSKENIEDNLSRALVICLQNNSLLFYEFLRIIFKESNQEELLRTLLSDVGDNDAYSIDIQIETTDGNEEFTKVFAVAISGAELDMSTFFNHEANPHKKHITDIFISIKDIAILIEVKRNNEDCRKQLFEQVGAFTKEVIPETVYPVDLNWKKLMAFVNRIHGFQKVNGSPVVMISDFIDLVQGHNPNWIPIPPLASLENNKSSEHKIYSRLSAALKAIDSEENPILQYNDRIGLKLDLGWAREILMYTGKQEGEKLNLVFGYWPGNTKGQGTQLLRLIKDANWTPPNSIQVNNQQFAIDWGYEFKFCHFNRFVSHLVVAQEEIKKGKVLISNYNHWEHTGKYKKDQWGLLKEFLDDYLVDGYDWKEKMSWEDNFENKNRNYLTMSIGFQIEVVVPLEYLQTLDRDIADLEPLKNFILEMKQQLSTIISIKS